MPIKDRVTLKAFFETGDKPSELEFIDLLDSFVNFSDDVGTLVTNEILKWPLSPPEDRSCQRYQAW